MSFRQLKIKVINLGKCNTFSRISLQVNKNYVVIILTVKDGLKVTESCVLNK